MVFVTFNEKIFPIWSTWFRRHDCKLFKKRFRLDARKFSCSNQVAYNWNCPSVLRVNSGTISTCKKHVSCYIIDISHHASAGHIGVCIVNMGQ